MIRRALTLALLAAWSISVLSAAELATKKALTLEVAKEMAAAMEAFAKKNNWNVIMTILDDGGNLLYFQRMDGAQIGSIEVSIRKAESAVKFRRATKAFSDGVASRPQIMQLPGAMAFEGGLPITYQDQILGSIGVSGVTAEQDGMIAQSGLDALPRILGE